MKNVLISGASFAGLCSAYWFHQLGYEVTVVEINGSLKKGGTPVNILENTINVVRRMGILEQVITNSLHMEKMELKDAEDVTRNSSPMQKEEEYEIERDVLLYIIYDLVKDRVNFVFGNSITGLVGKESGMKVSFKNGEIKDYDLVVGCDGIHSAVRRLWFGHESEYSHFLKTYFSITIIDQLLIEENTTQLYSEPGKTIMLNTYNGKTDIVFCFHSENEIPYDYRNEEQMRNIIYQQFEGMIWRAPELLAEVKKSTTFYFDKLCQMKMPSWTKGCVALVGDAGYCASPAAGRGGSLAIDGAAALFDALEENESYEQAFAGYNRAFRPFIEEVQAVAAGFGLEMLVPKTQEEIEQRFSQGLGF